MTRGALHSQDANIPRVVRDTMELVRGLGEKYLWVDALCIVQDDNDDKANQISRMDAVYNNALITIIAAATTGAHESLPGVGQTPRLSQHVEEINGIHMTVPHSQFPTALESTVWLTRGWTYQERLLSPRRLYVLADQAFFECHGASLGEWYEAKIPNVPRLFDELWGEYRDSVPRYQDTVTRYTERTLSWPSDILNAFAGIAAAWGKGFKTPMSNGLPLNQMEYTLVWEPVMFVGRRAPETVDNTSQRAFPTWSWAGWEGPVRYKTIASDGEIKDEIRNFSVTRTKLLPSQSSFSGDPKSTLCDVLEFKSTSAFFTVSHHEAIAFPTFNKTGNHHYGISFRIFDSTPTYCGAAFGLEPDLVEGRDAALYECVLLSRSRVITPMLDNRDIFFRKGKPIMVKSRSDMLKYMLMPETAKEWPKEGPAISLDASGFKLVGSNGLAKPWSMINVLIIKTVANGEFAERVGIGQMHEDAWSRAKHQEKVFRII
ncbi:heterokaryon incompatibility protein-domain-containing protein [Lineolata rhizophorae]|uniref:Heterokaryon incompatibility protein-domain-containing protein n=1 Tax=Lineolata rhizophorae TaxID=578093 RepID=A0A6A6P3D8_9PEZI|nr:heterokaryon incompatibility protein-domain-containing protein [Lineolata rhizophorae]